MANVPPNGSRHPAVGSDQPLSPLPVPELETGELTAPSGPPSSVAVSDEDRNRFGVLLDHAAERGLLGPGEYQVRLRELADANSIEEMTEIVSALPAFAATTPAKRADATPDPLSFGALPSTRRRRNPPWVLLAIVVAVILVAMVALAVVAAHTVDNHHAGAQSAATILGVTRL